jgi:hypothetical protein
MACYRDSFNFLTLFYVTSAEFLDISQPFDKEGRTGLVYKLKRLSH